MSIDAKRIRAATQLESLGYRFVGGSWQSPPASPPTNSRLLAAADVMLHRLKQRADTLAGCTEGSEQESELRAVREAIDAYESVRGLQ